MDYSKPTLIVISGPNGAGKSTHIQTMLPNLFLGVNSFDRDQNRVNFEKELILPNLTRAEISIVASRLMEQKLLDEMKQAILYQNHFVLETPLSHTDYWKYIDMFEIAGYQVQLNYFA